jgi:hypothetical protein
MTHRKSWKCIDQPGGCPCQCHAIAAAKAANPQRRRGLWTPQRDDELRALMLAGTSQKEVAVRLGVTVNAIRHRQMELGLSVRAGWRSDFEVQRALGVSWRFTRRWRLDGQLVFRGHDTSTWHRISDADLEAFVRQYAGVLLDPARVRDAKLRQIAEVAAVVNRRKAG